MEKKKKKNRERENEEGDLYYTLAVIDRTSDSSSESAEARSSVGLKSSASPF